MNNKISQTTVECPKCGEHTFQDRLNPDSDMPFYSNIVGKCNNQECNYTMTPKQFNTQYFAGYILDNNLWRNEEPQMRSNFFIECNIEYCDEKHIAKTGLYEFLCSMFDDKLVLQAFQKYYVSLDENEPNKNIIKYWYMDNDKHIYNTKLVSYSFISGKSYSINGQRLPTPTVHLSDDNSINDYDKRHSQNFCLFGLHLVDTTSTNEICLVEDERTAIIASIAYPDIVWVATGGQEICYPLLKPLIGLDVTLFPSNYQYYQWKEIADQYEFKLSTILKRQINLPGTDISDYILSKSDTWHQ